ncbi:hypothetical protein O3P69_010952 [Scylla paramamosain]|uniref:Uncharacterized protein n=1 Tax=Scylla paramamosain TaxID=85552 RepID=A0AAW0SD44_SCYPA
MRNGPTRIAGGRGTGAREGRRRQIRDSKQKHRDSTSGSVRHSSLQDLKCDWRPGGEWRRGCPPHPSSEWH